MAKTNAEIIDSICDLAKQNNDPYKFGVQVVELLYENRFISAETKSILIENE